MKEMEEKEIQRGRWSCSHKPQHSSKLSKCFLRASKMPKIRFPSRKQKKRGKLDTSTKTAAWRKPLTTRRKPPNSAELCMYRSAVSRCRQAVSCWKGDFRLAGAWRLALEEGVAWRCLCGARRLLFLPHLVSFCLLLATHDHSLVWIFGTKLPIYKKDTKMGINGIFRLM